MSDQAVAAAIEKIVHSDEASTDVSRDGKCVDCGNEIGSERLAVLPGAARCIRCQASWEQTNRS
jgi:RNA polymerase-binding transcription factor DksA